MDTISILVVDDKRQNLITLEAVLEDERLRVVTVTSAREALRRLLHEEFAAILLDVHMPDMDGFETASLIRQRPLSAHTPILFLTAYAVEAQLSKAYALGAVDYMPTPVQPEVLRAKVGVFADLFRQRLEVRRQAELLREAEEKLRLQAESALRESEGRYQVLCTSAPVGIFQLDTHGMCVYASPMWTTTAGRPVEDALGIKWASAISDGRGVEVLTAWRQAQLEGRPWSFESELGSGGEDSRWIHVRTSPIVADDGCTIGHVGTVEDITPRKRTEARLVEADRRKDEFLAMLAHELRNPLAAISSAAAIARTPHLEREHGWSMAVIARQVRHLEKLLDDLMDVSRITIGKITMSREYVDLGVVLARAVEAIQPSVDQHRQHVTVDLGQVPIGVDGDPTRLEQIFANLLGNASKYSEDGGRIWLTATAVGGSVEVRVRDEGIGLEPEMAERVFDMFAQVKTSLDRGKGGLGIGLSLARRLTELHGGRIRVRSDGLGHGAEFIVTLPVAAAVEVSREPRLGAVDAVPAPPASRKVLLADDNADATQALAMLLTHAGFAVVTARDGAEALARAAECGPEIVLLDLGLPTLDGYRVAEALRASPHGAGALLIAITGYGQPEDRARSMAVGFDHHLVKPVDCAELVALMKFGTPAGRYGAPGSSASAFGTSR